MSACGGTPRDSRAPIVAQPHTADAGRPPPTEDLERPRPPKLLSIDWGTVTLASEADAIALWRQIAPTGADWSEKLDEIPSEGTLSNQLAMALLHGGNFTCTPPTAVKDCVHAPPDVADPAPAATFDDPCLRRLLAMWSIEQLDDDELVTAQDALRGIAAIPPPESQLVSVAIRALPEDARDATLELLALAYQAGHRELVNGLLGSLDEAHLIDAVQKHHIDGALQALTAETNRPVFLAAITDEKLAAPARIQAMTELVTSEDKLAKDVRAALIAATKSPDCAIVASAERQLLHAGEKKLGPGRPRTTSTKTMMRALCVMASFEALQSADEPSFLLSYVPKKGLELVKVTYDAYSDSDDDGDGDPHTERTATVVPRDELVLPEIEDMIRAFAHCTGTVCKSDDREFRFTFKGAPGDRAPEALLLTKLEIIERPPCKPTPESPGKSAIPNP